MDHGNGDVKYAHWDGSQWIVEVVQGDGE
jgi:hypothetical protein